MKISSFDEHAFKRASKLLSQQSTAGVNVCQDRLAQVAGYRDYHEARQFLNNPGRARISTSYIQQAEVTSALSTSLTINSGDVLDILYRSRFFGPAAMDPDDAITVRELIFQKNEFPQGNLKSQGLVCKTRIKGRPAERAILVDEGPLTKLMSDHGIMTVVKNEFQRHRTLAEFFIPLRFYAVYGMWEEVGGSKVLFSRDYCPLWKVADGQAPVRDDPFRRVNFTAQTYYFDEGSFGAEVESVRRQSADILREFRIQSVPRLVEHLPELIASKQWISDIKYQRTFS